MYSRTSAINDVNEALIDFLNTKYWDNSSNKECTPYAYKEGPFFKVGCGADVLKLCKTFHPQKLLVGLKLKMKQLDGHKIG